MPSNTTLIARSEYTQMLPAMQAVRDGIEGSTAIKSRADVDNGTAGTRYLPNPSEVDIGSAENAARYASYLKRAEFDEFPAQTLSATLGKLRIEDTTIELPPSIDYMELDADGDGQTLKALSEYVASECLQLKWCAVVAEYEGLSGLDIDQLSKADADELQPRSTIKVYERESIIDWEFERRNGVLQLIYIVLRHVGSEFDDISRVRTTVTSDLVLGLDKDNNYYQQKVVDGAEGEREYVTVNGAALQWIPLVFVADQEFKSGRLPKSMGYMGPIVQAAIERYQVSADYKDTLKYLSPTTYTKGWRSGDLDVFREANGRDSIVTGPGSVNNLPNEVDVMTVGGDGDTNDFVTYMNNNERKIRALGGVFKTDDSSDRTATEAAMDSAERVAKLETLVTNIEQGIKKALSYCAMFEGAVQPDSVDQIVDSIVFDMPRDFAKPKMSHEEVRVISELVLSGLYTANQAVRKLVEGGWGVDDAQTMIDEIETAGPAPALDDAPVVPAE